MSKQFDKDNIEILESGDVVVKLKPSDLEEYNLDDINKAVDEKKAEYEKAKADKNKKFKLSRLDILALGEKISAEVAKTVYKDLDYNEQVGVDVLKHDNEDGFALKIKIYRTRDKNKGDVLLSYSIKNY